MNVNEYVNEQGGDGAGPWQGESHPPAISHALTYTLTYTFSYPYPYTFTFSYPYTLGMVVFDPDRDPQLAVGRP